MSLEFKLHISSRKSDLAKLQSYFVADALKKKFPQVEINFQFKESLGDINLTDPLWKIPEKGVFTEDFNYDLLDEKTDLVVHSWKDLPTEKKANLSVVATLPRADQRDLLLVKKSSLDRIRHLKSIHLFSSSPRRFYNLDQFLKTHYPSGLNEIKFESVRGNIPTRLKKLLMTEHIDGLILAKAALDRLLNNNYEDLKESRLFISDILKEMNWMVLPLSENPNAAAQGSIAIEIKSQRSDLLEILKNINHVDTFHHTEKERSLLAEHGGGCHQKIGVTSLAHKYGEVLFTKGLTDAGKILSEKSLHSAHQIKIKNKFKSEQLWCDSTSNKYFDRVALDFNLSINPHSQAVFITKTEHLTQSFENCVVWTSGTSTWKKCAALGIWVNGCQDYLGEDFLKNIDSLTTQPLEWFKITHQEAPETKGYKNIFTYKLVRNSEPFNFKSKKCFYWNSSSLFLAALSEHPEIASAIHCCGPGQTAEIIEKKLGPDSLWNSLFIFLNQEQWSKYVTE